MSFTYSPTIHVLQQLVDSVDNKSTQSLNRAVRLWYTLKTLYDDNKYNDAIKNVNTNIRNNEQSKIEPHQFAYRQYLRFFYNENLSNKTIKELFFPGAGAWASDHWNEWKEDFQNQYPNLPQNNKQKIDDFLTSLETQRPFEVSDKAIENDLNDLCKQKWLKKINKFSQINLYEKVDELPPLEESANGKNTSTKISQFFPFNIGEARELEEITTYFYQPIKGIQRFLITPEDKIFKNSVYTHVQEINKQLRMFWERDSIPFLKITYLSASSKNKDYQCIVDPACIYYYQRAFYLCAWGTTPKNQELCDWYNYRLERIKSLEEYNSNNEEIFEELQKRRDEYIKYEDESTDSQIAEIQEALNEAYGVDFYKEPAEMLIRFRQDFYESYIQNTVRHETFNKIDYQDALNKVPNNLKERLKQNQEDAYYQLRYRKDDNSVIMRLRAWGPNVEVLLPQDLRERMKKDMKTTWSHYQDDNK